MIWKDDPIALKAVQTATSNPHYRAKDILTLLSTFGYSIPYNTLRRQLQEAGFSRELGYKAIKRKNTPIGSLDPPIYHDKQEGVFSWRKATALMREMQQLKQDASWSQDTAHFEILTESPICIAPFSDLHMGSWATDYHVLQTITDELLETPNLYGFLLGDEMQMAIKMRSVLEISDNLLPPEMQDLYFSDWLDETQHKLLSATWSNHAEMREEAQAGRSFSSLIKKRRVVYHNGIGHVDLQVGQQLYKIALSHFFRGRSMYNPVHGQMRYMRMEAPDREIVIAGDSHVPGLMQFVEGGTVRTAINGGTAQIESGYGKRFFSLKTFPVFPCVVLDPHHHRVTPLWSVADWLSLQQR